MTAPPPNSDIQLLGECQGIVNFNAKVSDRALDLGMAQ